MSIFAEIASKIFGSRHAQADQPENPTSGSWAQTQPSQGTQRQSSGQQGYQQGTQHAAQQRGTQQSAPQQQGSMQSGIQQGSSAKPIPQSQVEEMIRNIAHQKGQKSNWNESIVDLLKLLDIDSSLDARKQLAQELGYQGTLDGSAEMNTWLHKQVMAQLAEGGGKVPDSLRH